MADYSLAASIAPTSDMQQRLAGAWAQGHSWWGPQGKQQHGTVSPCMRQHHAACTETSRPVHHACYEYPLRV